MTALPRVSVVVFSHQRPVFLSRCLLSLSQLDHPDYEIVVAADSAGLEAVARLPFAARLKTVRVDAPGISAARNAGLAQAAAEVVAFIDDDAVAEPTWLRHLSAAFTDPGVDAAGGYVLGRNGISFQWTGRSVDVTGRHAPLTVAGADPVVFAGRPGRAIKTEGTNMAFRRARLAALGGFDPAYRFFLDETDLNMRLAHIGARTAIVPLARVHHGFAASSRRSPARAPRDLADIGSSSAVFLRKFAPGDELAPAMNALRRAQRARVLRHMVAGRLEPRDVGRLMRTLEAGIEAGMARDPAPPRPLPPPAAPFLRFRAGPAKAHCLLVGRPWQVRGLRARAASMVRDGQPVTLFVFSPTALYHRMVFADAGYWVQTGGIFGRAERDAPLWQWQGFSSRCQREAARLAPVRPFLSDPAGKVRDPHPCR